MITGKLKEAWAELTNVDKMLDRCEVAIDRINQRPRANGRETPFWGEKEFLFARGDTQHIESPLITSAGSVTRVLRLAASVQVQSLNGTVDRRVTMRPVPRGGYAVFDFNDGARFDFEWSYVIESTQRQYASAQINADGINWLASKSLGNPEIASQLLFNPKNPLVLRTNEFLTFRVKPTVHDFLTGQDESDRFAVNIIYAGYRTFGYDS